ncbi:uncharacterized protein LOC117322457 [Pecten maximus]|uniref:uncharacterized protein LOC117322457 n=1 Tax=Pecten maximus TaxID=6579 RepID=UPI001458DDE7|nr:uncharacterized protein LOC117322457 [Pecten maximus]
MDHHWIILVLVTLYKVGLTIENGDKINDSLWLYNVYATWNEAFGMCKRNDASLAVPDKDEEKDVRAALNPKKYDEVWVGQYTYTTPWMYPTGCYSSNNPNFTRMEQNSLTTCKHLCGDSDIMVNIYNCLCVEKNPDTNTRKPLEQCNTSCPGNKEEYCGGQNVFQHYATYTDIKEDSSRHDRYCGLMEKLTSIDLLPHDCRVQNAFLCAVHGNVSNDRPFYIPKYNNGRIRYLPFKDALEYCVKNGSYLADPTKLVLNQFKSREPAQYWVGVRRYITYVTSVHELPSKVRNQRCLYIIKGSAGVTPDRTRDCSMKAAFLCRKRVEPTTASNGGITSNAGTSHAKNTPNTTRSQSSTVTSEITGTPTTDITTDHGNQEPPSTGIDSWPYIAAGAGFFVVIIALVTVAMVCLWRSRRKTSELAADIIPLETHNYDYLDIMITGNEDETNRLGDGRYENTTDSTETTIGQKEAATSDSPINENENTTCSNFTGRIKPSISSDENISDNLYCLADNSKEDKSSPKLSSSSLACGTKPHTKPHTSKSPYDYAHSVIGDRGKTDDSENVEDDIYNQLHAPHTSHNRPADDVYDHANAMSYEGCYHDISKPGHVNKEENVNAYDSTHNILNSDVYNTLSIKGSRVNGNDTYNPYVDTHIDPPLP